MSKNVKGITKSKDLKNSRLIFHLTDTYFIKESKIGEKIDLPGFGRVCGMLESLSENKKGRENVLFLHSGDFLFPSFLSNYFKGKQMVDILNQCRLDYCTLGNHDFDGGLKVLKERIKESKFEYIITNLIPSKLLSQKILQYGVWPKKRPVVAILGIAGKMTTDKAVENGFKIKNIKVVLKEVLFEIRQKFPEVKLLAVLSHMGNSEDVSLKKMLNRNRFFSSIILGGHDHNEVSSFDSKRDKCMLLKGQSNARTTQMIILDEKIKEFNHDLKKNVMVLRSKDFENVTISRRTSRRIEFWYKKLKKQKHLPPDLTIRKFPKNIILDATEVSLRNGTTNFGNFVTDCLKESTKADISFINSGHFRSDRKFLEKLTLYDLINTFVLDQKEVILVTKLSKKECVLFLKHAYSHVGKGKVLQFSKDTLRILKKARGNRVFKVALIADMVFSDEDGFGQILSKSRKTSIAKLRKTLKKDIIPNMNLTGIISKVAKDIDYDPKTRLQVGAKII